MQERICNGLCRKKKKATKRGHCVCLLPMPDSVPGALPRSRRCELRPRWETPTSWIDECRGRTRWSWACKSECLEGPNAVDGCAAWQGVGQRSSHSQTKNPLALCRPHSLLVPHLLSHQNLTRTSLSPLTPFPSLHSPSTTFFYTHRSLQQDIGHSPHHQPRFK